jgi:hypothetical protein
MPTLAKKNSILRGVGLWTTTVVVHYHRVTMTGQCRET